MNITYKRLIDPDKIIGPMNTTIDKDIFEEREPSISLWNQMIRTCGGVPHSPVRSIIYRFYITDVPYWVSVHYVRHHIGVQFYIQSQRSDKTGINRDELPQGALVNIIMDVNINGLINIMKARLCTKASEETRELAKGIKKVLYESKDKYDEALSRFLQPTCGWCNTCFESQPCKKQFKGK